MRNAGVTLLELLVVLALGAIVLSWTVPRVRDTQDRWATRAAQNALAQAVRTARLAARSTGSAELVVRLDSASVRLVRPGQADRILDLNNAFGVALRSGTLVGGTVRLRFGRLGLGRFASRSFDIRRGGSQRAVVVSTYGRVTRR